jgi:hypothetical protein
MFCSLLLICIADYHAALFPTRREWYCLQTEQPLY